jgi:hypothetical protein
MANRIYRGPNDRQPKTVSNLPVSGALLPGTAVFVTGTNLTQAAAVSGGRLALLADRDFYSQAHFDATLPLMVPYADGDTGVAYLPEPQQEYQWAFAAGAYTRGQELTLAAGGRLAAAAAGAVVVAHFDGPAATLAAGALGDVVIANFYAKA